MATEASLNLLELELLFTDRGKLELPLLPLARTWLFSFCNNEDIFVLITATNGSLH